MEISFQVVANQLWNAPLPLKSMQKIDSFKSQIEDVFIQAELIILYNICIAPYNTIL